MKLHQETDKISDSALDEMRILASLPVKKITARTGAIYCSVASMKAALGFGTPIEPAWETLREVIETAVANSDLGVFDELSRAWKMTVGTVFEVPTDGQPPRAMKFANPPSRPITVAVVDAIRKVQTRENRLPTRDEILSTISIKIDAVELGRQLNRLGIDSF